MTLFFSMLQRKIHPRFLVSKSHLHFSTYTSQSLPILDIDSLQSIQSMSENPLFCLLNLCRTLSSLHKIHALLINNGGTEDPLLKTKLIGLYGLFGQIKDARQLFDEIPNPDFDSYKVMIRWYFMNDLYNDVLSFYKLMRSRFSLLDNVVFSFVLKACTDLRDFDEGLKLHGYILQMGHPIPDSFVLTGLVDMYAKCGEIETARKVFERIKDRNVVCWTSMIVGYIQNDCPKEGLLLFNRMRGCLVEGNTYTLGSIVTACAKFKALHQGKWVHGNVIKNGIQVNSYLLTTLLDMYIKCEAIGDARLIFYQYSIIDLVSWTAMIVGYSQSGLAEEALLLFKERQFRDIILPNSVTLASVLSACAQSDNPNLGSAVHSLAIKLGQDDVNVMNAVVDMYAKCHRIEEAIYMFESMEEKDVVSWNSIISGYTQNGYAYKALRLFNYMRLNYFEPDPVTLVAVLSACASVGDIRLGSSLHAYSIRQGFFLGSPNNVHVCTALLNLYAKCGDAESAHYVFQGMAEKNKVTWNAMIGGYGKQGDSSKCFELFNSMLKEKSMEPSDIVFTAILSVCSHTGMIEEGWRYFHIMCRSYNYLPSIGHYVCMVDLLARYGQLEEAWDFIEKMPIEPNCSVFGAFLHGCNMHSRFDLGEVAVRKMTQLHPNDAGHYLLMSNLNVCNGKMSQASELRGFIEKRGLKKSIGSSTVNEVYNERVPSFG